MKRSYQPPVESRWLSIARLRVVPPYRPPVERGPSCAHPHGAEGPLALTLPRATVFDAASARERRRLRGRRRDLSRRRQSGSVTHRALTPGIACAGPVWMQDPKDFEQAFSRLVQDNLSTAKAVGLAIPPSVLAGADRIIE